MYLLDTNVCVRYLNGRSLLVRERLQATKADDTYVCAIVKAELFYGAMRSNNPERTLTNQKRFINLFTSLPYTREFSRISDLHLEDWEI